MKSEDTPIKRIQTHDIIVAFAYAQGYGDVLFALKVAALVRKGLKEAKKLTGDVYVVAKEGLGYNYIIDVKGDLDFGVTAIKKEEIKTYIDNGIITLSYVIDGPIFSKLYNPLDSIPAAVLLMPEYSEPNPAPISQVNVVNKYIKACGNNADNVEYIKTGLPLKENDTKKKKTEAEVNNDTKDEKANAAINDNSQDEKTEAEKNKEYIVAKNKTKGPCEGILLSHELMEKSDSKNISYWFALRPEYRRTLLQSTDDEFYTPAEYQIKKGLSFVYKKGFSGVARFLLIYLKHQKKLLSHGGLKKHQDVFIVCNEEDCDINIFTVLKGLIKKTRKLNAYSQIDFVNLTIDEHAMFQPKGDGKLSLRIIYAKSFSHEEMIALQALSSEFVGMTGDQSFSEAVSADKIIEYEVARKEKRLLIDGYCRLGKSVSELARSAIDELGHPYSLGGELRGELNTKELAKKLVNSDITKDIHAVNKIIHDEFDLENEIMKIIVDKIPAPNDEISQSIIDKKADRLQKHLANNTFEHGELQSLLQLAIKYGHVDIVNLILEQPGVNFNHADAFGNTPLILAAQHKQYNVIKAFIEHHGDKVDLYARNQMNRAMFDYLPKSLSNNKQPLLETCGLLSSFDLKTAISNLIQPIENNHNASDTSSILRDIVMLSQHIRETNLPDTEIVGMLLVVKNVLSEHNEPESIRTLSNNISKLIDTDLGFEQYKFTDEQGCSHLEAICEDAFKDYFTRHTELPQQAPILNSRFGSQNNWFCQN